MKYTKNALLAAMWMTIMIHYEPSITTQTGVFDQLVNLAIVLFCGCFAVLRVTEAVKASIADDALEDVMNERKACKNKTEK